MSPNASRDLAEPEIRLQAPVRSSRDARVPGCPKGAGTVLFAALAAVLAMMPACSNCPEPGPVAEGAGTPFLLEGWRYGRIGEAPGAGRYRLRLSVRFEPAKTADAAAGDEAGLAMAPPEFRLMLEQKGEGSFTCLRSVAGGLELVRFFGGSRVDVSGKSWTALPELADFLRRGAEPLSLVLHVDRSPERWAVSLFGEEVLAISAPRPSRPPSSAVAGASLPSGGDIAWAATPEWKLEARSVQPVASIAFDDAFEHERFSGAGEYELLSGDWRLDSPRDTSRTVNAFRLRGSGRSGSPAVAAVGHDFWRNYRVEASIKFPGPGTGGLVFAGRPGKRLGVLRWSCPQQDRPSPDGTGPTGRALLEVLEAEHFTTPEWAGPLSTEYAERVLVSLPWRPRMNQWYRVAVSIFEETGELEVNGRRATFRLPRGLRSGVCGLYSESNRGVLFDDLRVRSNAGFVYTRGDLVSPLAMADGLRSGQVDPNEHRAMRSRLSALPEGPVRLEFRPSRGADMLDISWRDEDGGNVSLALFRNGPTGGMKGSLSLERNSPTRPARELAAFEVPPPALKRGLALEISDDNCAVLDGDTTLASSMVRARRAGSFRFLLGADGDQSELDYLAGGPLAGPVPIRHKSPAFRDVDVTVNNNGEKYPEVRWGGFVKWIEDRDAWDVSDGAVRLRAPLWGDLDVELGPAGTENWHGKAGAGLYLLPDRGEEPPLGVSLVQDEDGLAVTGLQGQVLRRLSDDKGSPPVDGRIRIRRLGDTVEALVGGEVVSRVQLNRRSAVRVEARGPGVGPGNVAIRTALVDESLFEAAPAEWIRWRGHWDVTDKWQCDPRWTFLGLWADAPDTKEEAAGLFSRASYFGDQYLHYNFAFKDILGGRVEQRRYVRRDLNFAFCCRGEDLASGYCLLIGGFDNRGTQLLRKGKIVAETDSLRFPKFTGGVGDIHWNWYSLEITRRGGMIGVRLNGKKVLEWTDPDPLDGGQVAAWVLGGGMILGRTRFSAERRGPDLAGFEVAPRAVSFPEGWRPLDLDHPVAIAGTYAGAVRATNRAGGGHFGVEFRPRADGGARPPRAFAFRASEVTRVQASLGFRGNVTRSALPPGGGGMLPADGEWHPFPFPEQEGALDEARFGAWGSDGYLAAGIGGNPAGAWYEVKFFPSADAARRFCSSAAIEDAF